MISVWFRSVTLVDDVQIPDSLQKSKHNFPGELILELLETEQILAAVESAAAHREGGIVNLKIEVNTCNAWITGEYFSQKFNFSQIFLDQFCQILMKIIIK